MIGDLIPQEDVHWKLYILLRKIVDILLSPHKPKFHFLTHYATVLEYFGPCVHFQSARFESRHREIKGNFQATACNKNPLKSIAYKQILKMCQIVDSMNFENKIIFNSKDLSGQMIILKVLQLTELRMQLDHI